MYTYPLTQPLLEAVASLVGESDSPLAAGLSKMQARLQANDSQTAAAEALNTEMTRLLEGPGLTPAPPFASYYLHDGQLMEPAAVAARRVYLNWHVLPDSEVCLPDDHIALELGFLAHLARLATEAESDADRIAALNGSRSFIRNHLQPWLPRFSAALAEGSTDPFFVGLAGLTSAAVEADLEWLTALGTENGAERTEMSHHVERGRSR